MITVFVDEPRDSLEYVSDASRSRTRTRSFIGEGQNPQLNVVSIMIVSQEDCCI